MTRQKTKPTESKKKERTILETQVYTRTVPNAALTITQLFNEKLDVNTLVTDLKDKVKRVRDGNMRDIESMLITQAQTLNLIFNKMIIEMINSEFISKMQANAEIALKAQNQCRQTLTVLTDLKNPKRRTFISQQNNALNQQVNTNVAAGNLKKSEKPTNELLIEESKHEALGLREPQETITVNTQMETMEKLDGS